MFSVGLNCHHMVKQYKYHHLSFQLIIIKFIRLNFNIYFVQFIQNQFVFIKLNQKMNKPGILQLKTNVEQQTKRLLSQLQQLEYFKADIDQEQYNSLKQSTLNDLHTFQQSLNNMLKDPNNSILQSQIEKSKRQIYQTVKSKFNKDQIVNKILNEQVKGTRIHIMELDKQHHLKNISTKQFMTKKRNMIIKIQETGAELTKQQAQWLATNQNFSQNIGQINEQTSANNLKIAQSNIQKNM